MSITEFSIASMFSDQRDPKISVVIVADGHGDAGAWLGALFRWLAGGL